MLGQAPNCSQAALSRGVLPMPKRRQSWPRLLAAHNQIRKQNQQLEHHRNEPAGKQLAAAPVV